MIAHERVALVFEDPTGIPPLQIRRGKDRPDPAELPHQRREIHRARRDPGQCAPRTGRRGHLLGQGYRASASRPRISIEFSRNLGRLKARCKSGSKGSAWGCRSPGNWPSCWEERFGRKRAGRGFDVFRDRDPRVFRHDGAHEEGRPVVAARRPSAPGARSRGRRPRRLSWRDPKRP